MINKNRKMPETVKTISNNENISDEYILYLLSKLQNSQNDIKNNRVFTVEASKARLREKYENFDIKWGTKGFIRELIYKNYRIIYEVQENSKIIYIHFIIHVKRNFKSFYKNYIKNNF